MSDLKTISDKIYAGFFSILGSGFVSSGVGALVGSIASVAWKAGHGTLVASDFNKAPSGSCIDLWSQQKDLDKKRQEENSRIFERQQEDRLAQQWRESMQHSWKMHNSAEYYRMQDNA